MLLGARQFFATRKAAPPRESEVEWLEFSGTQWVRLDDIAPNYYTTRYITLDYRLTSIMSGVIQSTGSSSMSVTLCTGGGYVQSISTGLYADTDRHILTINGVTSPYHVEYDGQDVLTFYRSGNTERRFTIAAAEQASAYNQLCWMQFYGMMIAPSASGALEHDFVPWRIGDVGCVKDLVADKVYYPNLPVAVGPDKS